MITIGFKDVSINNLETYFQRIQAAVAFLTDEQIWWKPHENTISIGNILKHLNGNVTQWIISGLGIEADARIRANEFKDDEKPSLDVLLHQLEYTINKSCDIIESVGEIELNEKVMIQGFQVKKFEAIYHVVEHFSWHTGQITWIAKMLKGDKHGIAFYDDAKLNAKH